MLGVKTLYALILVAALAPTTSAADEPLTIKGVTLGDSIDKINQIGVCTLNRGGMCVGTTSYSPVPDAGFMVTYVAGRISHIGVTFNPRHSKEVLAGLTRRFGEPTATGCKPGVTDCHTWQRGGMTLLLVESAAGVMLNRAASPDGY